MADRDELKTEILSQIVLLRHEACADGAFYGKITPKTEQIEERLIAMLRASVKPNAELQSQVDELNYWLTEMVVPFAGLTLQQRVKEMGERLLAAYKESTAPVQPVAWMQSVRDTTCDIKAAQIFVMTDEWKKYLQAEGGHEDYINSHDVPLYAAPQPIAASPSIVPSDEQIIEAADVTCSAWFAPTEEYMFKRDSLKRFAELLTTASAQGEES